MSEVKKEAIKQMLKVLVLQDGVDALIELAANQLWDLSERVTKLETRLKEKEQDDTN